MGTRRKVAIWFKRGRKEYVVMPPGWKPKEGFIVFSDKAQMIEFARASGLVLKDGNRRMETA